jgi:hypothetical protein
MKTIVKQNNKLACYEYYPYKENDIFKNEEFLKQEKLNNLKEQLPTSTEVMEQRNIATE